MKSTAVEYERSGFKQYNPLKPIKRGIKLIKQKCRADALNTGYVYNMQTYFVKDKKVPDRTLRSEMLLLTEPFYETGGIYSPKSGNITDKWIDHHLLARH